MVHNQLIVVLGSGHVGKTSVLQKYLNGTFSCKYNETIEDMHCHNVSIDGKQVMTKFLDTSGSIEFPAMRRLAIQKANAFMLVFAIDSKDSFAEVKRTWKEIKLTRNDHRDIPCIVIGNKLDRENYREVECFEAMNWVGQNGLEGMMQEVSPKTGRNFENVFTKLFEQMGLCRALPKTVTKKKLCKKSLIEKCDKNAIASRITRLFNWFACGKTKTTE